MVVSGKAREVSTGAAYYMEGLSTSMVETDLAMPYTKLFCASQYHSAISVSLSITSVCLILLPAELDLEGRLRIVFDRIWQIPQLVLLHF